MSKIDVTARYDSAGRVIPLRFSWQGRVYPVEAVGRRWQDGAGEHILALTPAGEVFELVFVASESRWLMSRPAPGGVAI